MRFVVTYDIDRMHTEVKVAARKAGFWDCIDMQQGPRQRLPNTTLFKEAPDGPTAMGQFRAVVASVSPYIQVQKVFCTELGQHWLDSDEVC